MTDVTPTVSEEMEADARGVEKPEGSPELVPFISLPRRVRADFLRAVGKITERQAEIDKMTKSKKGDMSAAVTMMELLADMEDALAVVAKPEKTFRAWALEAEDAAITDLFSWYFRAFSVGESPASTS